MTISKSSLAELDALTLIEARNIKADRKRRITAEHVAGRILRKNPVRAAYKKDEEKTQERILKSIEKNHPEVQDAVETIKEEQEQKATVKPARKRKSKPKAK